MMALTCCFCQSWVINLLLLFWSSRCASVQSLTSLASSRQRRFMDGQISLLHFFHSFHHGNQANAERQSWGKGGKWSTDPWCRCALQVLEQWESQLGLGSPAQTSLSAPVPPHSIRFPTQHLHRASFPDSACEALAKPDPYDLFEKSMAIYESRRKYQSCLQVKAHTYQQSVWSRWIHQSLTFLFLT